VELAAALGIPWHHLTDYPDEVIATYLEVLDLRAE
jgi:hypothetical protein